METMSNGNARNKNTILQMNSLDDFLIRLDKAKQRINNIKGKKSIKLSQLLYQIIKLNKLIILIKKQNLIN